MYIACCLKAFANATTQTNLLTHVHTYKTHTLTWPLTQALQWDLSHTLTH